MLAGIAYFAPSHTVHLIRGTSLGRSLNVFKTSFENLCCMDCFVLTLQRKFNLFNSFATEFHDSELIQKYEDDYANDRS